MRTIDMTIRKTVAVAALALVGTAACMDLDIQNPNDADAERALATAGDVEALIGGGWGTWWDAVSANTGPGPILMTSANQHSATAANFGMVEFSSWPRKAVHHLAADVYYGQFANAWTWHYRAISAVVDGLNAIEDGLVELPPNDLARATAYGNYVLGLAHASTAIMFDQGYIYDESIAREDVVLHTYTDVLSAALGYFDKAIAAAEGATFTIPATWMSVEVSSAQLARLAYSMKARYRAAVARNPAERAAVDWAAVASDASKGVTADWAVSVVSGSGFSSGTLSNIHRYGPWGQLSYQVLGMADQSGQYQKWISISDPWSRHPNLSADQQSDQFLIQTPDERFPTGATVAAQQASDGKLFEVATASGGFGAQWARPDRGTFRWSYYRYVANNMWLLPSAQRTSAVEVSVDEMRLLRAEAAYRTNNRGQAADLINVTRTAAGLNATDAAGANTSCVPKLPTGACGDLFEMLKWEVRLETMYQGLHMAPWYFHGRGWGDLAEGTFLQFPVPGREASLLNIPAYTFGGIGGEGAAPVGTYGY
jgi:starch-binding outer membrane protein, SusD/RagB family